MVCGQKIWEISNIRVWHLTQIPGHYPANSRPDYGAKDTHPDDDALHLDDDYTGQGHVQPVFDIAKENLE